MCRLRTTSRNSMGPPCRSGPTESSVGAGRVCAWLTHPTCPAPSRWWPGPPAVRVGGSPSRSARPAPPSGAPGGAPGPSGRSTTAPRRSRRPPSWSRPRVGAPGGAPGPAGWESARPEPIEEPAELVTAAGGRGIAVAVDHLVPAEVSDLVARIEAESGRLDVLVNDIWGGEKLF